jgi:hypothetical protein
VRECERKKKSQVFCTIQEEAREKEHPPTTTTNTCFIHHDELDEQTMRFFIAAWFDQPVILLCQI